MQILAEPCDSSCVYDFSQFDLGGSGLALIAVNTGAMLFGSVRRFITSGFSRFLSICVLHKSGLSSDCLGFMCSFKTREKAV